MSFFKIIISFLSLALILQGCARIKSYDIEPVARGGYVVRGRATTWSEPAGTAANRATQDAIKYCKLEGRDAAIKALKTHPGDSSLTEIAEAEFDCMPLPSRAAQ